ncbi:hypothetical protein C5167_017308 [Papaver somniferum]|uniref:Uncharacterized protein n=1 Tax=Papaver somniferum TaxID=3469 RepID=A0A4Y7IN53_PAPSO|nr:hypothetical protein C5167_017308 [Papaver somniferum]
MLKLSLKRASYPAHIRKKALSVLMPSSDRIVREILQRPEMMLHMRLSMKTSNSFPGLLFTQDDQMMPNEE